MTIIYRAVKGSNLTADEVDGNFHDVDDRLTVVEGEIPTLKSISTIAILGSNFVITFSDATTVSIPIPVPSITFRGAWAALTSYLTNDVFTINGKVYIVERDHISAGSFDPGAIDTSGNLYGLLLANADSALPTGGAAGFQLIKTTSADFDTEWAARLISGLSDVILGTDLSVGDTLVFDGADWVNGVPIISLDGLSDVIISGTSLASGDVLRYDGLDWVNAQLSYSDLAGSPSFTLDSLTDVIIGSTGLAIGSVLQYDGSHWIDDFLTFSHLSGSVGDTQLLQTRKQVVASSAGVLSINRALGEMITVSLTENITSILVTNWPASGTLGKLTIDFASTGSFTVAGWQNAATAVYAVGGSAPTVTSGSGKKDTVVYRTWDGGATARLDVVGQDYQAL